MADIFQITPTITFYDLTNTYREGNAASNPKAKRGRSKEKRSDCPLLTLGIALDASGFIRHSKVFEGNVSEGSTLREMLTQLQAPQGALVIMDAGIASEENLQWLTKNNYNYLVVSRERNRNMDMCKTRVIESACGHQIHLQRLPGSHENEIKLACWSEQRAASKQTHPGVYKLRTTLTDWDDETLWGAPTPCSSIWNPSSAA